MTNEEFREALSKAAASIGAIAKDARNTQQNYGYTSATAVQAKVRKAIFGAGLLVSSDTELVSEGSFVTRSKSEMHRVTLKVTVKIHDGNGNEVSGVGIGCGSDVMDKAPMKAQTAGYKYALCAALCIPMGDDPEADQDTEEEDEEEKNAHQVAARVRSALAKIDDPGAFRDAITPKLFAYVMSVGERHKRIPWGVILERGRALQIPEDEIGSYMADAKKAYQTESEAA